MKQRVLLFSVLFLLMLSACGGKKTQAESTDAVIADSTVILAQEEMTGLPQFIVSFLLLILVSLPFFHLYVSI